MAYMDPESAMQTIPVLKMLFQSSDEIKQRARKIASALKKASKATDITIVQDMSKAGGGSLPDKEFQTFAVQIRPELISVNELEKRLRHASPPVIARIRENALLIDARTIRGHEIKDLVRIVAAALSA